MSTTVSHYETLQQEDLTPAERIAYFNNVEKVWQPVRTTNLDGETDTESVRWFIPLRMHTDGDIPPHRFAENMSKVRPGDVCELTMVHNAVLLLRNINLQIKNDVIKNSIEMSLANSHEGVLGDDPDDEAEQLFIQMRNSERLETKRQRIASMVSAITRNNELYVVSTDTKKRKNIYVSQLAGLVATGTIEKGSLRVLVKDKDGQEGYLPPSHHLYSGVSAEIFPSN